MKNIIIKLDRYVCRYLGIEKIEVVPLVVKKVGKKIVVLGTESFKRHVSKTTISGDNISAMSDANKKRLGAAVGQALASNLTVSFDEIQIRRE